MFSSKSEVDKHVENCLKNCSEKERNNRSFQIARLYYNVGAFETAKRYVSSYLSNKQKSPEGHHLLGMCLEKLGKKDAALEAYRTSLKLDPKQNNLLIKVCDLLAATNSDLDLNDAKYFCQLAENVDPQNAAVYNLKEKLLTSDNKNPDDVVKFLLNELEKQPTDVNLRIRLLKNFIQNNRIREAYKHVSEIEDKNLSIFANNLAWYETVSHVLMLHKSTSLNADLGWSFWLLQISVLNKILTMRLDEKTEGVTDSADYVKQLFLFDQSLYEASHGMDDCPDRQLSRQFLDHFQGQLFLHYATAIFKQAKADMIPFKEASSITLPLLFLAYHCKPADRLIIWSTNLQDRYKTIAETWRRETAFRCSQSGHTLLAASKDKKSTILARATKHSSGPWREQVFKKIFVLRPQQLKMSTSYFVTDHVDVTLKWPTKEELLEFDEESLYAFPDDLHHYIWISSENDLVDLNYSPFSGLQYSVKNLRNCGAETLNLLDVQAFLYCATLCAKQRLKNLNQSLYFNSDKPDVLPEAVTEQLGTEEQSKFLVAAYKMYRNDPSSNLGEVRMVLIRGIETVRCAGRHGLDVGLLIKLAQIFAQKARLSTNQSEIEYTDARAELYWKTALSLLETSKKNQLITYSKNRIFEYKSKDMSWQEINSSIDEGKLFLGILAMKRKEYEDALKIFDDLKDPYASFYQGQIYRQMADDQMNQNRENVTSEMRSQNVILLSKARDCFYLTLDRLREPSTDRDHPLNEQLGTEIEKIERLLSRIDPDCSNGIQFEAVSDDNVSNDSNEHFTSANNTAQTSNIFHSLYLNSSRNDTRNIRSTPIRPNVSRKEARPSPERLDAQLRQLAASKDTAMNQVLEQNKLMVESHKCFVEELRGFREAVYSLSEQVENLKTIKSGLDELKDIKKSIDELKSSVDELQTARNVTDMVYELKKEIADIKKDTNKKSHQQHNAGHDDYYVLDDEDYNDYNINSNVHFNPNLYQNFPNRLPPNVSHSAAEIQRAIYAHSLYPALYGPIPPYSYPNIGLTQPPPISYGGDQQLPPDLLGLTNPIAQPPAMNNLYQTQPLGQSAPSLQTHFQLPTSGSASMGVAPSILPTSSMPSASLTAISASSVSTKSAPVNVVITSSDPLPSLKVSVAQPVLSVTIPPQHIKSTQPHNYQIALPTFSAQSTPSVLNKPAPISSTSSMFGASDVSDKKNPSKNLGVQIEKSLEKTFETTNIPPEVVGNDAIIFQCPAKLYTYSDGSNELKEKGSGILRLLENKAKQSVRILMHHDVGRVIANHYVANDLIMTPIPDNSYTWTVSDYSTGARAVEKFCLKFKNNADAKRFGEAFESLKQKPKPNDIKVITTAATSTLGGFVFSSSPIFKPKETDPTPVTAPVVTTPDAKTSSPFANFSFIAASKNGTSSSSPLTDLSKSIPSLLSGVSSKTEETKSKLNDSASSDDFVPTAEFKPVVPLPDIVEVRTGEEDAEVLFDCRAKLLRFDAEKKEWKERGLGNMKILKEKHLIRLLMRREQIHKVCCNHQLLKSMNFQYMPNNLKALTWCAQDYADEVLKTETFAIRFKTEEQANDFLKCILKSQSLLNDEHSLTSTKPDVKEEKTTLSFGDKFKPPKGNWECKNCYVSNDVNSTKCLACETPKIPAQPKVSAVAAAPSKPVVSSSWGDAFKPKAGTWECNCCMIRNEANVLYCVSCETPKDDTVPKKETGVGSSLKGVNLDTPFKFSFGINATPSTATPPTTAFKFGASSTTAPATFSFGSNSFNFQATPVKQDSPKSQEFEFKMRSPKKSIGPGDEESDCSYVEEEADNIYFKPVIPLPNKVEVKTGEEDEETIYSHRAKLYRYVDGEWKERGIGDLKILKNKFNGKLRVLMRRDQIFKICLNHVLNSTVDYMKKDDKTWLFSAADFSEGEVSQDQFCLRFKTPEIAQEFKRAVGDALGQSQQSGSCEAVAVKEEQEGSDDDLIFVSETEVTEAELKEAQKLSLPPKFFAYRRKDWCKCDQCIKDDQYFKGTEFVVAPALEKVTYSTPKTESSIGSSSFVTASPFVSPQETLKDILAKPSLFRDNSSMPVNLSTTIAVDTKSPDSKSFSSASSSFGNKFSSGGSLFDSKPSFDNALKTFSFTKSPGNVFAATKEGNGDVSKSPFGTPTTVIQSTPNSLFASSQKNVFSVGQAADTNKNPFGSISTGSLFGENTSAFKMGAQYVFGQGSNIFGNLNQPGSTFETKPNETGKSALNEDVDVVLKCKTDVTFASLAQQNKDLAPEFCRAEEKDNTSTQRFSFPGVGTPVFGSLKTAKPGNSTNTSVQEELKEESEEAVAGGADEEYDPHYEPIVPMPEAIVVSTGEEDEVAVFNERGKLYRYDADLKEWKERGVGQMKILHHPVNGTYRFLLRREQVHKAVLNQLITPNLTIQPMSTSEKAWIWAGHNFVDDETRLEKLAVRFKDQKIADAFRTSVEACVKALETTTSTTNDVKIENVNSESEEDDEEYDEDDDDYDEDRTMMFSKNCVLEELANGEWVEVSQGEIQVYYDSEVYGARISFIDAEGETLSNGLIGINTVMKNEDNSCSWQTVEWATDKFYRRDLRAVFETEDDAKLFHETYLEGLSYAQEWEIRDDIPSEYPSGTS